MAYYYKVNAFPIDIMERIKINSWRVNSQLLRMCTPQITTYEQSGLNPLARMRNGVVFFEYMLSIFPCKHRAQLQNSVSDPVATLH